MRAALLAIACLGVVGCGSEAPEVHPIYIEVDIDDGEVYPPCAERAGTFETMSVRDLELTAVNRIDNTRPHSCVLPVDARHERLLLYGVGCTLVDGDDAKVSIDTFAADGARMAGVRIDLSDDAPTARRTFGAGMPLMIDVEMSGSGGRARCWLSGMYVRTTDEDALWGPWRLVSHGGEGNPNPDRR